MQVWPIRYARNDGVSIAYQLMGQGRAMLAIPPLAQNLELAWELPEFREIFERHASFAHVVHFDKRGTGVSDRASGVPTLEQHVDDARCVMDAVGFDRAVVLGLSDGGPMSMLLAVTYPERVEALVLVTTAATFAPPVGESERRREARRAFRRRWLDNWGTEQSPTLDVLAPSVAGDADYRTWWARYERQSATPAAIAEMFSMQDEIDVRPILEAIAVPTLVVHRRDDPVISSERAQELATRIPGAQFVEVPGRDHFAQVGDRTIWLDAVERFVTGTVTARVTRPTSVHVPEIRMMGGFEVRIGGDVVPLSAWGSRRSRQLCKRLAVALGQPVTRDELADLLWPGDDPERLPSRLSVQLSTVRRILGGAIVADRASVRLDLAAVDLDLDAFQRALAAGDDAQAVALHRGELLPEDAYADWTAGPRIRLRDQMIGAHRRLATTASGANDHDLAIDHLAAILELDPYDEPAHEQRTLALAAAGRYGEAQRADERYRAAMAELGLHPQMLLTGSKENGDARW